MQGSDKMARQNSKRTTVYNNITSKEKLAQVNKDNLELENDWLEYLSSADKSKGTLNQYRANLHVFWCWNLEKNKNKFFIDITKREFTKFQSTAVSEWGWAPKRLITVKATLRSLENYIVRILDDEFPDYKPKVCNIESPTNEVVREKTIFTKKQLQGLLDKLVENGDYMKACALSLAMNSGKRKAELPRFKVSYFNKDNLICEGALYKTPEKIKTKGRGSNGKQLDVYTLAKPFQPYFDLWMNKRKELKIKSDWLFPKYDRDGKWYDEPISVITMDSWANTFSKLLEKDFYWHSVRHFFTTSLLESNLPESIVQNMQGWSSSDMVRIYDDRDKDEEFEKFFGAEGIKDVKQSSLKEL